MEAFISSSRSFAETVRRVTLEWKPQLVQAEFQRMAQYLPPLRDLVPATVIVAHEADSASASDALAAARGAERIFRALDLRAWRFYEAAALRSADAIVTFTDRDRSILAKRVPGLRIVTIPLRIGIPPRALDPVGDWPPTILFVGGFGHVPNVDAAIRLASSIFPIVRSRQPEARLEIVGDKPPRSVRVLEGDGIVVTGRVLDVEPYIARAAVVAAPLRLGGGMRLKVLEALGAGKPLVATTRAVEGVPVSDGVEALIADSDFAFAEAILRLLDDPEARRSLGLRARRWAETNLNVAQSVADYDRLYHELTGTAAA